MSSLVESKASFTKLKGRENYDNWKIAAKSYLVIKKLWKCILKEPDQNKTEEIEVDLTAWAELNLLLDETVYSHIANTNTAKAAWDALEKSFEDSGLCRKVELLKQMVRLTLNNCDSIEGYVTKMITISLKVKKAGLNIDDEVVASFMLAGLPDEFSPLVMAMENSSNKLTIDSVKTTLLQEPRFQKLLNETESEAFVVKGNRDQKANNFRCHCCGEVGHFARYCSKRSNEESNGLIARRGDTFCSKRSNEESNGLIVRRGDAF